MSQFRINFGFGLLSQRQQMALYIAGGTLLNGILYPSIERLAEQEGWLKEAVIVIEPISAFVAGPYFITALVLLLAVHFGPPLISAIRSALEGRSMLQSFIANGLAPQPMSAVLVFDGTRSDLLLTFNVKNISKSRLYAEAIEASVALSDAEAYYCTSLPTSSPILAGEVQSAHSHIIPLSTFGGGLVGEIEVVFAYGTKPDKLNRELRYSVQLIGYPIHRNQLAFGANAIELLPQVRTGLQYGKRSQTKRAEAFARGTEGKGSEELSQRT